ncbi:MAG: pyrimidine 5'-nucleotidase [Pseudomonadota bacterium]
MSRLDNRDIWVFDLDNTLYPSDCDLFELVSDRMNEFIVDALSVDLEEAKRLRRDYYLRFGTTLAGLMELHDIEPDGFLDFVHDIDHSRLDENPALDQAIRALPGRKLIYTNGSRGHAEGVAGKIGILDAFEEIFDIKAADYIPKPAPTAFRAFLAKHAVAPERAAMFEDLPHNLLPAHTAGMTTVLVHSDFDDHPSQKSATATERPAYIDHRTENLTGFLEEVVAAMS